MDAGLLYATKPQSSVVFQILANSIPYLTFDISRKARSSLGFSLPTTSTTMVEKQSRKVDGSMPVVHEAKNSNCLRLKHPLNQWLRCEKTEDVGNRLTDIGHEFQRPTHSSRIDLENGGSNLVTCD